VTKMSRSRSPTPTKGYRQRRRSRSTSPTVLSKEEQLKTIADLTITNIGRHRCYDVFGDEKQFWSAVESQKRHEKTHTNLALGDETVLNQNHGPLHFA